MTPAEKLATKTKRRRPQGVGRRKTPLRSTLRFLRRKLELSIREVSAVVGITQGALSEIERGTDPLLTTAMKLAQFYGHPIEKIWSKP